MTDNLAIWNALERTDPNHVKEITGKAYRGNSPRPHWIIFRLTERFGPVGLGFGWRVLGEDYIDGIPHQDGTERTHECRIEFWWRDGGERNSVESYGATKALYKTRKGEWVSDEDAAKKSLTDAVTKAASWLGASADIFLGRWDDSKYVADLRREADATETPARANQKPEPAQASGPPPLSQQAAPSGPREEPFLSKAMGEAILLGINNCADKAALDAYMEALRNGPNAFAAHNPKIKVAASDRYAKLDTPIIMGETRIAG